MWCLYQQNVKHTNGETLLAILALAIAPAAPALLATPLLKDVSHVAHTYLPTFSLEACMGMGIPTPMEFPFPCEWE